MFELIQHDWQLKLGVILFCSVMKFIGEIFWHDAQRFIMPVIYSVVVSVISGYWWLGITTLPMIAPITFGYKTYGPSDGFDRGAWLFVISVFAGIGPLLSHHLAWYCYIPTTIICGIWGATTRKLWNIIIAPITGALIGSMILWIH